VRHTRRVHRFDPRPLTKQQNSAQFGDNLYGTSKATIQEQSAKGKTVVLDIEVEGVKQIQASGFPARYVFIAPPSEEELEKRLRGRGTEKEESIQKRLTQAKVELEYAKVPGVHDRVIVNDVSLRCPTAGIVVGVGVLTRNRIWRRRTRSSRSLSLLSRQRALRFVRFPCLFGYRLFIPGISSVISLSPRV
jgi:hypothetical protein